MKNIFQFSHCLFQKCHTRSLNRKMKRNLSNLDFSRSMIKDESPTSKQTILYIYIIMIEKKIKRKQKYYIILIYSDSK